MNLENIFQGQLTPYKWKLLGDYLKGQQIHKGKGIRLENSHTSGVTVSAVPFREVRQSQAPPFSVLSLKPVPDSNPKQFKAELQEGYVVERHTRSTADGVQYHECAIGGTVMSTRPRPEVTLEHGDYVQVYYETDEEGFVTSVPAIQVGAQSDSIHHQPPSGESAGSLGYYYLDLFKFEIDAGGPVIQYIQQSDIEHSRLWSGRNVGGARYIHKQWDGPDDRYDFRTLKQFEPTGRTYGKVIVDPVGPEIDDVNDAIKFSAIAERATNPQVNVSDDGAGIVTVEGNGVNGSLRFEDCIGTERATINWVDGLITTAGDFTVVVPDCSSGGTP